MQLHRQYLQSENLEQLAYIDTVLRRKAGERCADLARPLDGVRASDSFFGWIGSAALRQFYQGPQFKALRMELNLKRLLLDRLLSFESEKLINGTLPMWWPQLPLEPTDYLILCFPLDSCTLIFDQRRNEHDTNLELQAGDLYLIDPSGIPNSIYTNSSARILFSYWTLRPAPKLTDLDRHFFDNEEVLSFLWQNKLEWEEDFESKLFPEFLE